MNEKQIDSLQLVVITGMSGAGKTVAVQSFEDMGFFCIDNLPPTLIPKFWELIKESGKITKIALVIDLRSRAFFEEIQSMLIEIENTKLVDTTIMFLEASDKELVSRYKETRRTHPLAMDGLVTEGIIKERSLLSELKGEAQLVIDTTNLAPRELREKIMANFKSNDTSTFRVEMVSFGFKYGLPIDADVVMDVRFLPNPHYVPKLRPMTGKDKPVYDYVMASEMTEDFYQQYEKLMLSIAACGLIFATSCKDTQKESSTDMEVVEENLETTGDELEADFNQAFEDAKAHVNEAKAKLEEAIKNGDKKAEEEAQKALEAAQKTWDETATKAKELGADIKEGTEEAVENLKENANQKIEEAKVKAEEAKENANKKIEESKEKADKAKEEASKGLQNAADQLKK
jgi:UPF0042 nucleotide-binding protein